MSDYQVVYRGIVHDSTGYARASREYLLALDRQGVDIKIDPMNFGTTPTRLLETQAQRIRELIQKPYAENKKKILIYHAQPNGVDPLIERQRFDKVIVNTVWETTQVPTNWFPNVNHADAVIVPSRQNVEALRDSGVTVPIYLVPHGADTEQYKPGSERLNLPPVQDTFNFLSVFQWQHRKGPDALLAAFWAEFTKEEPVSLLVKSYWGHSKESGRGIRLAISNYKRTLGFGEETAPVYLSTSHFSDQDMKSLYALGDVFVLPTRGEGVGLPYIEALSSEVPVIATGWGGQVDFLTEHNAYLVDYALVPAVDPPDSLAPNFHGLFTKEMKWAEPLVSSLRRQMRTAYENQEEAKAKGKQGRLDMLNMSWDTSGAMFKEAIEEVIR